MADKMSIYAEFWPYYLGEHSNPLCRKLHFIGTTLALIAFTAFVITGEAIYLLLALFCGYALAWTGHFFVEKNRPATFKYPLWSLISDFRMYFLWISGNLDKDLKSTIVKE